MSTSIQRLLKMQRFSRATKRYYGHRNRRRDRLDRGEIVAAHHAVAIDSTEQDLTSPVVDQVAGGVLEAEGGIVPFTPNAYYVALLEYLEASNNSLRSMFFGDFSQEAGPPERSVTATELVRSMEEAKLKIGGRYETAADRYRHEALAGQLPNEREVRPPSYWRVNLQKNQLIHPSRIVYLGLSDS